MSKSPEAAQKVFTARAADQVHLLLCDALFQFQLWRSPQSHAHLEQPRGSQMIYQEELQVILDHAMIAQCDMCLAGQLKHPVSGKLIQKGTQIITTSRIMHRQIDVLRCTHNHEHDTVCDHFNTPNWVESMFLNTQSCTPDSLRSGSPDACSVLPKCVRHPCPKLSKRLSNSPMKVSKLLLLNARRS